MKSRSKKAFYNGLSGLGYEIVTIVCGLILPRLILTAFGSSYNGITQSIAQFLSFVALLKAGVGAVTKAALYKPLASGDKLEISRIIRATEIFMRRIAVIFAIGLIVFAVVYPILVTDEFEWIFSFSLVLIIGISTFAQYYFGITYQMLLEADQSLYIVSIIQIFTTIANLVIAAILINLGAGIHTVKLGSALIFAFTPIAINIIVRRKYKIDKKVSPDNTALSQRWDAFAQQLAMLVRDNSAIIIITMVSNVLEVSVYSVYFMIIKALNGFIRAFTNGIGAAFGNMLAKGETEVMKKNLRIYEILVYSLTSILYSATYILITSFVLIYTAGITDISYNRPVFGYIMAFGYTFFCIRIPYQNIVEVAGHFKQTKNGAYIEAILNLVVSILLGIKFGIVGVAIGTLVAMLFRTLQYGIYISKNIVKRSSWVFIKHLLLSMVNMALIIIVCNLMPLPEATSYFSWFINGIIVFVVATLITVIINLIFYKDDFMGLFRKMLMLSKKKKIKSI